EPQPSPEPSPVAPPTGDTTPIPEPGFVPESLRQVDAGPIAGTDPTLVPHEQVHVAAGDSDAYDLRLDVYAVLGFPPPSEPTPPAADSAVPDTQGQVIVNDDVADSMVGRGPEDSSDTRHDGPAAEDAFHEEATSDDVHGQPATSHDPHHEPVDSEHAGDEAAAVEPPHDGPPIASEVGTGDPEGEVRHGDEPSAEPGSEHSEHPRWFDRAKMWAANNLYDPDEDRPAPDPHPRDEQNL
ncbi:MAG TPA: hypothetical protein VFK68_09605, partial [Propionibacteriaceae bacterium]|nr:hypothetical protein [Propionibacteriaceae bacterium]